MANQVQVLQDIGLPMEKEAGEKKQFLTMKIDNQIFGIPVTKVQDVLRPQKITKIPLSKPQILGLLNLRGRIVTVIDVRKRLEIDTTLDEVKKSKSRMVVVEHKSELYSLVVDEVGDVLDLPLSKFEKNPENLTNTWKDVSQGVFKLKDMLLLILDVEHLLSL